MRPRSLAAAALLATSLGTGSASAQYRLRADAFFGAADPTMGLIMLTGEARQPAWLTAETVVWAGAGLDHPGDVMVASVRIRDENGYGEARVGRMLVATGAIRPIHLDGADVTGKTPWGTSVEVFGGVPVVSSFQPRDWDWAVGGRAAQRISQYGVIGVSYLQMREDGAVTYEELGVDSTLHATDWLDAGFKSAIDLQSLQLADARLSISARIKRQRLELFALQRSPSHLLPATSLFSALGDLRPSQRVGASLLIRPAPRLDVLAEGMLESMASSSGPVSTGPESNTNAELGGQGLLRATLRLDDKGTGALALEGRRMSTPGAGWTGVRATARVPFFHEIFAASTELELVAPDDSRGRGSIWPWGLVALRYKPAPRWEVAGAFEASSSPTAVSSLSGLLRASYQWSHK